MSITIFVTIDLFSILFNWIKIGKLINFQLINFKYQRRFYFPILTITKKQPEKLEQSKLFYIPTGREKS